MTFTVIPAICRRSLFMISFYYSSLLLLLLSPSSSSLAAAAVVTYNVVNMGAVGDGKTDTSKAFQSAWASACASAKPATIYVPAGRYLLRSASFSGQLCKSTAGITIRIDNGGILVAPSNYNVVGKSGKWITFDRVSGISIYGGTLDGQGARLWSCKASSSSHNNHHCPKGATTLSFYNSNNIIIEGLASLNSQMFHILLDGCHNARLQGVKVTAPGNSPNTDGIHLQSSSGVTISDAHISTGDDCISIGPGNINIWIQNIACGPGHGISIGSLGWDFQEPGVQNVTVCRVTFTGTENGVRIKTWAKPSSGFVKDVVFQHADMINVENPIIIDQDYCPDQKHCPAHQDSGVKISGVTYEDIHGTSATQVAVKFNCSKKYPCSEIKLEDVNLTCKNQTAMASCNNAGGTTSGPVQPSSCL